MIRLQAHIDRIQILMAVVEYKTKLHKPRRVSSYWYLPAYLSDKVAAKKRFLPYRVCVLHGLQVWTQRKVGKLTTDVENVPNFLLWRLLCLSVSFLCCRHIPHTSVGCPGDSHVSAATRQQRDHGWPWYRLRPLQGLCGGEDSPRGPW